ncbi:uncharacterized protein LOC131436562 isoform X2 [Malaya genurostris]|uniref:uncharacterized protein LOC131436562 isoform X2 n=1 Tax=Malaya genurostris TaxID=325434 RepID=UPI0026F39F4D|nr:uncharacterized protein LOC131436562 isoform X2 [Malaya genurostris]
MDKLEDVFISEYFNSYETKSFDKSVLGSMNDFTGRQLKSPCACNRKCYEKISNQYRQKLFENLLNLSRDGQKQFISNHMQIFIPIRQRIQDSRRSVSRSYFFPTANGPIKVCKPMFMSTFDISDKKIRMLAADKEIEDVSPRKRRRKVQDYITSDNICEEDICISNATEQQLSDEKLELPRKYEIEDTEVTYSISDIKLDLEHLQGYEINECHSNEERILNKSVQHWRETRGYSFIRANGLEVPARHLKPACSCRLLCFEKFPTKSRQKILDELLKLSASNQNRFLASHFQLKISNRNSNSPCQYVYFLPANYGMVEVCKEMFLNTFDIQNEKLPGLIAKKSAGEYIFDEFALEKPFKTEDNQETNELESGVEETAMVHQNIKIKLEKFDDEVFDNINQQLGALNSDNYEARILKEEPNIMTEAYPMLQELQTNYSTEQLVDENVANYMQRYEISEHQKSSSKRQEQRRRRERGWSYIRTDGSKAPPRQIKPACSCRRFCNVKIQNESRQKLLDNLLKLSFDGQNHFLACHMKIMATKRQTRAFSRRQFSYAYYMPVEAGVMKVCKQFFMNTFDVGDKKMRLLAMRKDYPDVIVLDENGTAHELKEQVHVDFRHEGQNSDHDDDDLQTAFPNETYYGGNLREQQNYGDNLVYPHFRHHENNSNCPEKESSVDAEQLRRRKRGYSDILPSESVISTKRMKHTFDVTEANPETSKMLSEEKVEKEVMEENKLETLSNNENSLNRILLEEQIKKEDNQEEKDWINAFDDCIDTTLRIHYEGQSLKLEPNDDEVIDDARIGDLSLDRYGNNSVNVEAYPILQELQTFRNFEQLVNTNVANYMRRYEISECQEVSSERQKQRRRKEQGLSYIRVNGSAAPPRQIKSTCNCRMFCHSKLSDESRQKLLVNLLKLSFDGQNNFLTCHMKIIKPKRCRKITSKRHFSYIYYIPVEAGIMKVCKLFFLNTFDIGHKKLRLLALKKDFDGVVILDNNGVAHELLKPSPLCDRNSQTTYPYNLNHDVDLQTTFFEVVNNTDNLVEQPDYGGFLPYEGSNRCESEVNCGKYYSGMESANRHREPTDDYC